MSWIMGLAVAVAIFGVGLYLQRIGRRVRAGTLPPGHRAGLRTPATSTSSEAWKAGQEAAWTWMRVWQWICCVLGVLLFLVVLAVGAGPDGPQVVWGMSVAAAALVLLAGVVLYFPMRKAADRAALEADIAARGTGGGGAQGSPGS